MTLLLSHQALPDGPGDLAFTAIGARQLHPEMKDTRPMSKNRNTDVNGKPFAQTTVGAAWKKGKIIEKYDPNVRRYDMCGNPIKFSE